MNDGREQLGLSPQSSRDWLHLHQLSREESRVVKILLGSLLYELRVCDQHVGLLVSAGGSDQTAVLQVDVVNLPEVFSEGDVLAPNLMVDIEN